MRTILTGNSTYKEDKEALEKLSKNQIILFAADFALKSLPVFEQSHPHDKRPREAVEAAINYKNYKKDELKIFADTAWNAFSSIARSAAYAAWVAASFNFIDAVQICTHSCSNTINALVTSDNFTDSYTSWDWIYDLYTNALNKQSFNKTPDIQGLIQEIKDNRDFTLMPILFDALDDQGLEIDRKEPWGLSHWALSSG